MSKYYPTRSKAPNPEFNKRKGKVDVEHIKGEMNRTWKRRDEAAHPMEGSLHLKGQVVTLHLTKKEKVCGTDI